MSLKKIVKALSSLFDILNFFVFPRSNYIKNHTTYFSNVVRRQSNVYQMFSLEDK